MSHERVPSGKSADLRSFSIFRVEFLYLRASSFSIFRGSASHVGKKKKKEHAAKNRAKIRLIFSNSPEFSENPLLKSSLFLSIFLPSLLF